MTFRKTCNALIASITLSVLLSIGIHYVYFIQPDRNYYATSGVTPPVQLTDMDDPNYSAYPLLADEQVADTTIKSIPK